MLTLLAANNYYGADEALGVAAFGITAIFGFLVFISILIGLLGTFFWVWMLIDVTRRCFSDQNTKVIWLIVIIFTHLIGALIYFFIGRKTGNICQGGCEFCKAPAAPSASPKPPKAPIKKTRRIARK